MSGIHIFQRNNKSRCQELRIGLGKIYVCIYMLLLFSHPVVSNSLQHHGLQQTRLMSFAISQSLLKLLFIESVMPSNHLILCCPLLFLPSIFSSIRAFSNKLGLPIRWPKYWSFSIISSNEHSGLISLRLTGLISLQSKELSRVFSNTTVQKHQFFIAQPSL